MLAVERLFSTAVGGARAVSILVAIRLSFAAASLVHLPHIIAKHLPLAFIDNISFAIFDRTKWNPNLTR